MKHFILSKEPAAGIVRLSGSDFRYLVRVRRLSVGDFFPALLPGGEEVQIEVLSTDRGELTGKCLIKKPCAENICKTKFANDLPPIILFQALPKGDKMDLIVRQAAEGGITEIVPFVSEFSVLKKPDEISEQKFSRWEKIIKEARQQSGSKIATTVRRPITASGLFEYWETFKENSRGLLFHHIEVEHEQNSLHSYLKTAPESPLKTIIIAIGPEGGFSGKEVSLFLGNGFKPFTISDTILRTETAALYCAAAVKIILLERNSWELK